MPKSKSSVSESALQRYGSPTSSGTMWVSAIITGSFAAMNFWRSISAFSW